MESLLGKRISHVAVGISNAIVVTEDTQLIAWGSNQYGEFGTNNPTLMTGPTLVAKLDALDTLMGITLGPAQLVAWTASPTNHINELKGNFMIRIKKFRNIICLLISHLIETAGLFWCLLVFSFL